MNSWQEALPLWSLMADPLLGITIAVSWWGVVVLVRKAVSPAIQRWASRTRNRFDDAIAHALGALRWVWCLPVAIALALRTNVPVVVADALQSAAWIAVAVQAALVVSRFLDHSIRHARTVSGPTDDGQIGTGLAALSVAARFGVWTLVAITLLDNLGVDVGTLVAGLGVGGIAVGLAVQKVLGDLFAYFAILFDKPFELGHFIIVDGFSGTVEHIGIKTTRIRSLDGEIIVFGNADLTQSRLRNYRLMRERRVLLHFGVEYATPPQVVESIPTIVRESVEDVTGASFERAHFTAFGASSLDFEAVYWISEPDYALYMDVQQRINLALMQRFKQAGIEFAFPSRTIYLHKSTSRTDLT